MINIPFCTTYNEAELNAELVRLGVLTGEDVDAVWERFIHMHVRPSRAFELSQGAPATTWEVEHLATCAFCQRSVALFST